MDPQGIPTALGCVLGVGATPHRHRTQFVGTLAGPGSLPPHCISNITEAFLLIIYEPSCGLMAEQCALFAWRSRLSSHHAATCARPRSLTCCSMGLAAYFLVPTVQVACVLRLVYTQLSSRPVGVAYESKRALSSCSLLLSALPVPAFCSQLHCRSALGTLGLAVRAACCRAYGELVPEQAGVWPCAIVSRIRPAATC